MSGKFGLVIYVIILSVYMYVVCVWSGTWLYIVMSFGHILEGGSLC